MWFKTFLLLIFSAGAALAQEGTGGGQPPAAGDMLSRWLMMMAMIFFVFYFLVIRPQQKQRKEHEQKINSLSKGDRVMTSGGLYGSIVGIKETVAVLKIAENVKVEVSKNAINHVLGKDEKVE